MSRLPLLSLVFLSLLAVGSAEVSAPSETAADRGAALLETLEFDEALLGTHQYGIYMQGTKSIGTMVITVSAAEEGEGPGEAAYKVEANGNIAFGPMTSKIKETSWLDPQLALLASASHEVETTPEGAKETTKTVSLADGKWSRETKVDKAEATTESVDAAGPNHGGMAAGFLLSAWLPAEANSYELSTLAFDADGGPAVSPLTITVGEPEEFSFRGESVSVRRCSFVSVKDNVTSYVHEEGGIIAISPDPEVPFTMIAGDEESITKDIAAPASEDSADSAGARDAVRVYFDVLAHEKKVDALDGVLDWNAIYEEMGGESPHKTPESLATALKEGFAEGEAKVTKEEVEVLAEMLKVTIEGDAAKVEMPGHENDLFLLRKDGERWLIVHFPH